MKLLNKIIPISIYPFDLMVSLGETDLQFTESLNKFNIKPENCNEVELFRLNGKNTLRGRTVMFSGGQIVIRLNFKPRLINSSQMALLQHEIFHSVGFLMSEINTPLNESAHEAYAYLIQYLTEKIYADL